MKNTKTVYHTFDFSKTLYYDYIERDLFLNSLKFIQKSKKSLKKSFIIIMIYLEKNIINLHNFENVSKKNENKFSAYFRKKMEL